MTKSIPSDPKLYERVKKEVYAKYPKHSAYRSGILVKEYKKKFKNTTKSPYIGQTPKKEGLSRWFMENWKSDTGKYKYSSKSSVYRPSIRITNKTPTTFSELSKKELKHAKYKKRKYGRVDKFKQKSK